MPLGAFEAIYLARPLAAVAGEAYRHLVDPFGIDPALVALRMGFTVEVSLADALDLGSAGAPGRVGLSLEDPSGEHEVCQAAGLAAFEAGYRGIRAPSATGLGESLCVFSSHLEPGALEVVERRLWELPADPRG